MRISKWFAMTVAAAVTAGGLSILTTQAAEGQLGRYAERGRLLERAKERLGLTDEQVTQIKAELAGEKETLKSLFTRLHEARKGLRETIHSADATDTSVREAAAKVGAVQSDFAVERLKLYRRISPIFTDEQREKVKGFEAHIDEFVDSALSRFGERLRSGNGN